jgi:hypothetical protein
MEAFGEADGEAPDALQILPRTTKRVRFSSTDSAEGDAAPPGDTPVEGAGAAEGEPPPALRRGMTAEEALSSVTAKRRRPSRGAGPMGASEKPSQGASGGSPQQHGITVPSRPDISGSPLRHSLQQQSQQGAGLGGISGGFYGGGGMSRRLFDPSAVLAATMSSNPNRSPVSTKPTPARALGSSRAMALFSAASVAPPPPTSATGPQMQGPVLLGGARPPLCIGSPANAEAGTSQAEDPPPRSTSPPLLQSWGAEAEVTVGNGSVSVAFASAAGGRAAVDSGSAPGTSVGASGGAFEQAPAFSSELLHACSSSSSSSCSSSISVYDYGTASKGGVGGSSSSSSSSYSGCSSSGSSGSGKSSGSVRGNFSVSGSSRSGKSSNSNSKVKCSIGDVTAHSPIYGSGSASASDSGSGSTSLHSSQALFVEHTLVARKASCEGSGGTPPQLTAPHSLSLPHFPLYLSPSLEDSEEEPVDASLQQSDSTPDLAAGSQVSPLEMGLLAEGGGLHHLLAGLERGSGRKKGVVRLR